MDNQNTNQSAEQSISKPMPLNLPDGFRQRGYVHTNHELIAEKAEASRFPYRDGFSSLARPGRVNWNTFKNVFPLTGMNGFLTPCILRDGTDSPVETVTPEFLAAAQANPGKEDEFVLAVPAGRFIEMMLNQQFPDLTGSVLTETYFLRRNWCEENKDWVQLLPYIVFYKRVNGRLKIFVYQRGKGVGESRLAGNYSIGVGGHINPQDQFEYVQDELLGDLPGPHNRDHGTTGAIIRNIKREVGEEVIITRGGKEVSLADVTFQDEDDFSKYIFSKTVAFLDYSASNVEKVHLGLFIGIEVGEDVEIRTKEDSLIDVGFCDMEELYEKRDGIYTEKLGTKPLENWSMAIVESIWDSAVFAKEFENIDWRVGTIGRIVSPHMGRGVANVFLKI